MRTARDAAMKISEDEGNTEITPEAIKQIQAFKNGLYDSLQAYFTCEPAALPDPRALESDLYARFKIPVPRPTDPHATNNPDDRGPWTGLYLTDVWIEAQTVPDSRKLVAVRTSFEVPYGSDAELDVFAPDKDGHWSPVINLTSKPYKSIFGAFASFDYKISPHDAKGDWFVVATHVNPWPTSCWQDLFTDVVRPQDLGMEYQLFHDEQNGYICDDEAPYLRKVSADGFQTRFSISSLDEGQGSSVSLKTYKVTADEVTRIQPVALDPVNFVDEWTRNKWGDAQDWSASTNLTSLRKQHAEIHHRGSGDFVSDRSCAMTSLREVGFEELGENGGDGPTWYFLVQKSGDSYTMLRVSRRPTQSCKGPDRLSAINDR
jgi:hypothetical protein